MPVTLPLNAKYQFFNGTGTKRARLACVNAAPIVMNLFHDYEFTWDNSFNFKSRSGEANHFSGEGEFVPIPLLCTVTLGVPIRLRADEDKEAFLIRSRDALLALAPRNERAA